MTQEEIVTVTGLSRSRVLRVLAEARQDGTVQVRVTTGPARCAELAQALVERWGLTRAIVIPDPQDAGRIKPLLGAELGAYLSENLGSQSTLGLGWGQTLSHALPAIVPRQADGIRVLSLLGGLTRVSAVNPSEFAWRVADRLNAECHLLTAPAFAPDPETRAALCRHPGIAEIHARSRALDMAVVSVGALMSDSVLQVHGLLTREEIDSLAAAGVVGEVLCHFINAAGEIVPHPVNDRAMAVQPMNLRGARQAVLVSGGHHKQQVIRAALKLMKPSVLITNEGVAAFLAAAD